MSTVLFDAPGPRGRRRIAVINLVGALVVLAGLVWVVWALASKGQFAPEKWQPFLTASVWTDYLLIGLWNTLRAAGLSIVTSAVFGLIFGLGRLSQLRAGAGGVRRRRGVLPRGARADHDDLLLLPVLTLRGHGPPRRRRSTAWSSGLTLYNGSVMAELVRSGVQNLPRGQREAGLAVGLTPGQSLRLVELPQALIAMLPSVISQLVVILKDTALGYIISYSELLRSARLVGSTFANYVPALIVAAVIFIVVNYTADLGGGAGGPPAERAHHRHRRADGGTPAAAARPCRPSAGAEQARCGAPATHRARGRGAVRRRRAAPPVSPGPSRRLVARVLPLGGEDLVDHPHGHAGSEALAGEHGGEPAPADLPVQAGGAAGLLLHEAPGGGLLVGVVHLGQGGRRPPRGRCPSCAARRPARAAPARARRAGCARASPRTRCRRRARPR